MEYKPRPDEFFITDRRTGKKVLVKRKNETVSADRRSTYQRQQDQTRAKQVYRQYEEDKKQEEGMKNLQGFLTFVSPSTYIGPVFNNNGKSYAENVMSGEGTGDVAGNVAIDILTPFAIGGINKGVQIGNRFYGIRQFSKAIDNSSPTLQQIPLNIGWGPKQTIPVSHASGTGNMQLFFPKRWDVVNEGAKAAKARALFANRPVQVQGNVTLEKPMITIGDVPNRSWLSYYADDAGADGLIYNGIYDNGYNNNQVILSFKKMVRSNGSPFGKLSFKSGDASVDGLYKKIGEGSEAVVYEHPHIQIKY